MNLLKCEELKKLSNSEILEFYDTIEDYQAAINRCDPYNMAVSFIENETKRLMMARDWLLQRQSDIVFKDIEDDL